MEWDPICKKIRTAKKDDAMALMFMESSLGDPDVLRYNYNNGRVMFFDFSPESPRLRRNLSYGAAVTKAKNRGVSIATPDLYMEAFGVQPMDKNSDNWIHTSKWSLFWSNMVRTTRSFSDDVKEIRWCNKNDFDPKRGFRSYLVI